MLTAVRDYVDDVIVGCFQDQIEGSVFVTDPVRLGNVDEYRALFNEREWDHDFTRHDVEFLTDDELRAVGDSPEMIRLIERKVDDAISSSDCALVALRKAYGDSALTEHEINERLSAGVFPY